MNKKILKYSLIILGILPFIYLIYITFLHTIEYTNDILDVIRNIPVQFILEMLDYPYLLIGLIPLIIGILIDSKQPQNNTKEKKVPKNLKWKILLIIGLLPFIFVLAYGIYSMLEGFSFFSTSYHGIDAFIFFLFIFSFLFWPLYILGAALIIISVVKLKNSNSN